MLSMKLGEEGEVIPDDDYDCYEQAQWMVTMITLASCASGSGVSGVRSSLSVGMVASLKPVWHVFDEKCGWSIASGQMYVYILLRVS